MDDNWKSLAELPSHVEAMMIFYHLPHGRIIGTSNFRSRNLVAIFPALYDDLKKMHSSTEDPHGSLNEANIIVFRSYLNLYKSRCVT